jgi:hypothetical protein
MGHVDDEEVVWPPMGGHPMPPLPEIPRWLTLTGREAWKMPEDELREAASSVILNYYIQTGVDPLPGRDLRKLPRHELMKVITEHPEWFAEQLPR